MKLMYFDIPKIENDEIFEVLVKDILNADPLYNNINLHGRLGQKQDGVDVFARNQNNKNWIGINFDYEMKM